MKSTSTHSNALIEQLFELKNTLKEYKKSYKDHKEDLKDSKVTLRQKEKDYNADKEYLENKDRDLAILKQIEKTFLPQIKKMSDGINCREAIKDILGGFKSDLYEAMESIQNEYSDFDPSEIMDDIKNTQGDIKFYEKELKTLEKKIPKIESEIRGLNKTLMLSLKKKALVKGKVDTMKGTK
jgi:chromosome segregation ATPase